MRVCMHEARTIRRRVAGFSLIEIMIVVAALAILATIAIPSYTRMMTSINRADGRAALGAIATAQERYFSIYGRYVNDFSALVDKAGLDSSMVPLKGGKRMSTKERYELTLGVGPSGDINTSFTATATPISTDADCSAMTLNSLGVRGGSPATNKCW